MSRETQILAAATRLFAERSFDGVRLIDALLIRVGDPLPDPHEELAKFISVHVEFVLSNPELTTIWQNEQRSLSKVHGRSFQRRQRLYIDHWIQALDACHPGHDREHLATTVRAVHGLISSDIERPASVKRIPDLSQRLAAMTQAACAILAH